MRTIFAALDGSPRAEGVLATAIAIASAQRARLVLFRSLGLPTDVPQDLWRSTESPFLVAMEERAQKYLSQCEESVPIAIRGGTTVAVGTPSDAICRAAQALRADLVIIGSHGYGSLDRLLGTTAAKVVNHCACSVLVHKDPPPPA